MKTVCLFLKSPGPGEVKTRLARSLGPARATAIYRALVEHQLTEIPPEWRVTVYFAPAAAEEEMKIWLEPLLPLGNRFLPQGNGDLGRRLWDAVRAEFDSGSERLYLIGGDCPGLTRDYFYEADSSLNIYDVVIGPAEDGGYVLLGLKFPDEVLFRDIAWSTRAVLEQTLSAAEGQGLSVHLLRALVDIDDAATLKNQSKFFPFLRENCKLC